MRPETGSGGADVIAARSPVLCRFFGMVMRRHMRRHFHAVRVARPGLPNLPTDRPVIVYSNHPSWWDPAFFIVLSTTLMADRRGFGPMDAEALQQYRFMRRIGIFGVEPGTRAGAARFLQTSRTILADRDHVLWVTAEGAFRDPRARPVRLAPGTAHLMARLNGIVALPLALEYPFWQESRPEAVCRFGAVLPSDPGGTVAEWQSRLEVELAATMNQLAADSVAQDPGRFLPLLRGRGGIGGVYDLFRRGRAFVQGERFVPEHGQKT